MKKKHFKIILPSFLLFFLFNYTSAQSCKCRLSEAIKHNEEFCRITGIVSEVLCETNNKGNPTFINIGNKYPDNDLKIIIWAKYLKNFSKPIDTLYIGKNISVYGIVKIFNGKPTMIIKTEYDIEILKP